MLTLMYHQKKLAVDVPVKSIPISLKFQFTDKISIDNKSRFGYQDGSEVDLIDVGSRNTVH